MSDIFPSSLNRRNFLALSAALPMAARFPRALAAEIDLKAVTLRIAVFRGMDQTILPAVGLADFPYTVQFSEFNSGNLIAQAINADAIDIGIWSEIPMVFAAAAHSGVAVVATLDGPTTDQAVLVPAHSPLKSIQDLRGKRVGYIKATSCHYFLLKMLDAEGMSFSDIQPVALSMSEGLTALKSGSLDAWATYGYAIQLLESQGDARILQSAAEILSGHYFLGANPRRLNDLASRVAIADYIHRLSQAYAILSADKPRWAKVVAPVIHVPEDVVLAYLNGQNRIYHPRPWRQADIDGARQVVATFASAGVLPKTVDIEAIFSSALNPLLAG